MLPSSRVCAMIEFGMLPVGLRFRDITLYADRLHCSMFDRAKLVNFFQQNTGVHPLLSIRLSTSLK